MDEAADRRLVVATCAATAALALGGSRLMIAPDDRSQDTLGRIETGLATMARRWETMAPADLVDRLDVISRHTEAMSGRRQPAAIRRDWRRTHSRVLVMSAVAQGDNGLSGRAVVSARTALVLARHVGDAPTAAHAGVVLAELAAYTFDSADDGLSLAMAARATAPHSHTAILAMTTEANIRAGRGEPADRVMEVIREAESLARGAAPAAQGYALDGLHPGYLPTFGGAALVGAGALSEGRRRLSNAAALFDRSRAPGALAAVRLYQASAAMHADALDEAQTLATRALATSAVRPTAWLTNGIMSLATRARRRGADWAGLVAQAREWAPVAV
ncbi:hypothetical protein CcI49_29380 [Frankia sp. CcI49]|uniref:hypothetical protein n=1 Tax=unclassified Frankia TaxID=2632575 RepID=UPI0006C9FB45|nr:MULTISPECIES: hypothetical protein [unclassified Frankia]KPM53484.1 hypothetical protein ACG83_22615 [Frankia sp. R43]ONH54823.1 hypothetical protein CcI49_29380 [Frankia sp. CcI49]